MANLVATTPTRAGVATAGAAVAASDKITAAVLGSRGCILEINNGGGVVDNMTISDASVTPSGAAAAALAPSVANGASKVFEITPKMADANGEVTITHSSIATVTYKLYPR